ncbi:MAG: SCP2 sterol-binding domain-containing protein [Haloarculaceae archaeon]
MTETTDLAEQIDDALELPDDELAVELPAILDRVDGRVQAVAMDNPALFGRIVQRMGEMDVSDFAVEHPETVAQFQSVLWTGMDLLVQFSPDVQESIADDVAVNFDATDAPMTGHLELDAEDGSVAGGNELLADPDIEISGPADTLVSLITGGTDPVQGFMQQQFEMQGDVRKGTQLAQTMGKLTEKLPN